MALFDQTCPYCQKKLDSMSDVYCPHCGAILKAMQKDLDQERITSLCLRAEEHFLDEEWTDGIYLLIDALRLQPDNEETQRQLKEARHQFRLARLYEWAEEHYFAGSYNEALEHLEEISIESPDYRDTQEMIAHIHEEKSKKKTKKKRRQNFRDFFDLGVHWAYVFLITAFILIMVAAVFLLIGLPF